MWVRYGIAAGAGFVAALLLVFAIFGVRSLIDSPEPAAASTTEMTQPVMDGDGAIQVCRDEVADMLKDPSSATFDDEEVVQSDNEISWEVTGTVRGTNGFGGVVPTQYQCYATWQGDHFTATATLND